MFTLKLKHAAIQTSHINGIFVVVQVDLNDEVESSKLMVDGFDASMLVVPGCLGVER